MAECCPIKLAVKFLSLDFLQDHHLLKDAWLAGDGKPEWKDTGNLYTPFDWRQGKDPNPISYSMVTKLNPDRRNPVEAVPAKRIKMRVTVRLQIGPDNACPEKCQLYGIARDGEGNKSMVFKSGWIMLAPAPAREVTLNATPFIPLRISARDLIIDWYIRSHPSSRKSFPKMTHLESTMNRRYVTFAVPKWMVGSRESGVTHRRMNHSVKWVGKRNTNDHPAIIGYLFGRFDAYTLVELRPAGAGYSIGYANLSNAQRNDLKKHPALLKRLGDAGWSAYMKSAGAWPAADPDLVKWGAECQAICRLVIGILHQLGSDAEVELVYVAADFSSPNHADVKTGGNYPTGPDPTKEYVLVDAPVVKGKKYIEPVLDPADNKRKIPAGYADQNSVGWNNFEAYLRYRYKEGTSNVTRWYGGGVGEYKGNPVHVFWGIAEFEKGQSVIFGQIVEYIRITRVYSYQAKKYL